jgi:sialic acid synthase SpsE
MLKKPYFIAEIGVNHEANLKLAKKIIKDAKLSGASAVKLQSYKAEKLTSKYARSYWDKKAEKENNQLKLYKKYDKFGYKEYLKIIDYCKKIKIDFIITPFDIDQINFFKSKVKYFKISSSDITNFILIEKISLTNKPIILSTGASTISEIKAAIKIIKKKHNKIILLHCILNYPTKRYSANLNMIDDLKKTFKFPVGISDHTVSSDSHDVLIYSCFKEVEMIEKHFTNNKNKKGNDHFHSFDKNDLLSFFQKFNDVNKILGSSKKTYLKSEIKSRKNARRSLFYKSNLSKNSKINLKNIISLRPAIGICPSKYKEIIGKKVNIDVKKGDVVRYSHFK